MIREIQKETVTMATDLYPSKSNGKVTIGPARILIIPSTFKNTNLSWADIIFPNGILVLPCIKDTVIEEAAYENDRRLYTKLFNKIHAITNDVYNKFTENNIKLKEKIFFIKQNDNDSKFIDWLEINMNGFIESIDCKKKQIYFVNDTNQDDDSSITNNNNNTNSNGNDYNNVKIKKLTSKKKNSGFSTFSFIIFVLITSIFLGINIASLFIK